MATPIQPGVRGVPALPLSAGSPPPQLVSGDVSTSSTNSQLNFDLSPQGGSSALGQTLSLLLVVMQTLAASLNGTASPPGVATSKLATPVPTITNTTKAGADKTELDRSLASIADDPDGAKLLAKAKALGVTIEVGDPAKAGGAFDTVKGDGHDHDEEAAHDDDDGMGTNNDGNVVVNGVTLSNSQTGKIRIVVRDASNIKTIVHELVHAVSTGDGNSKQEEGIADVVGSRVASHTGGASVGALDGSDRQIFVNKQQFYPGLMANNDIRATLRALGIDISV